MMSSIDRDLRGRQPADATHRVDSIIGGMFGLEIGAVSSAKPFCLRGSPKLLASGRSAFTLLARFYQPKQVWLPSYFCDSVLPAFSTGNTAVRFYGVNAALKIESDDWIREVRQGDLVVFIDYFGFRNWDAVADKARERGAWIVEDACQALLLSNASPNAHYSIFSPRKFVGVPDGGILLAAAGVELPEVAIEPASREWWQDALTASVQRAEFDHGASEDRSWFKLYQQVESSVPSEPRLMSELSQCLLHHGIDWEFVARRRRENFQYLAASLADVAVFPELPNAVVPLGFPIRTRNRDSVRKALFATNVFPAVHWPLEGIVPSEFESSHRLAKEIMTIPCDQRTSPANLEKAVNIIRSHMN